MKLWVHYLFLFQAILVAYNTIHGGWPIIVMGYIHAILDYILSIDKIWPQPRLHPHLKFKPGCQYNLML